MKLVEELRLLEVDHEPSGWPAVQMRQISALCDEVDRRFGIVGELLVARRERDESRAERAKLVRVLEAAVALVCAPAWSGVSDEDVTLERVLRECGFVKPNAPCGPERRSNSTRAA
jgi:hypothetical protein